LAQPAASDETAVSDALPAINCLRETRDDISSSLQVGGSFQLI
jgi:hypothetical protein